MFHSVLCARDGKWKFLYKKVASLVLTFYYMGYFVHSVVSLFIGHVMLQII